MIKNYYGIITVRTNSKRLPNKCLLPFGDDNVLMHIVKRALYYNFDPIICTSIHKNDDIIEKIAKKNKVKFYRGSLKNKLLRWYNCAEHFNLDYFHTIDADDPFFDGDEMKESINLLLSKNLDIVRPSNQSSSGSASVGYSIKKQTLKKIISKFPKNSDTELIWNFIDQVNGIKQIKMKNRRKLALKLRLTLDYEEDYWLLESIRKLVGNFASRKKINQLFLKNPDLYLINWFRNIDYLKNQKNN